MTRWLIIADLPVAIALGDPAGIGPEIVVKSWAAREALHLPPFVAVGPAAALGAVGFDEFRPVACPADAAAVFARALPLIDISCDGAVMPGEPAASGARAALAALALAVDLARAGEATALVTGPVAKAQLYQAGFKWPGQTEFVADRCGVPPEQAAMLLVGGDLRVAPVTIHLPLSDVPRRLTADLIVKRASVVAAALTLDFGIAEPRLALTGLNPHAGEGGALGREDEEVIAPAIERLRAEGIDARGPFPADTLFHAAARASYDAAIAMYHDQALIPVKTLAFDTGVNMTVGLPIVRTSPDHGTAFGIAGRNAANPGAMVAAIRLAAECATRRRRM